MKLPNTCAAFVVFVVLLLPSAAAGQGGPPGGSPPGLGGPPPGQGGAPPAAGVPATATVQVDCAAGGSINDALATPAAELTVEISGICVEDVVVRRNDVTLIGTDPALDGMRGVDPDPANVLNAVLRIDGSSNVRVENLSIADGARVGVMVAGNSLAVDLVGCVVENTGRDGVQVIHSSVASLTDVTLRTHGRSGLAGFDGEFVSCTHCTIEDARFGLLLIGGTRGSIDGGSISGNDFGALLFNGGSSLEFFGTAVAGTPWAIGASDHASYLISGGTLDGAILAEIQSSVRLAGGANQTNNPLGFNVVDANSSLNLAGGSNGRGFFAVERFSEMTVLGGSTIDGDLGCNSGGDAFCEDPALITGGSSCGLCTIP